MIAAILAWLGCTCRPDPAIVGAFDEARAAALRAPPAVTEGWAPDLVVHLGSETVAELVTAGLSEVERDLRGEIPVGMGVALTTRLAVDDLRLASSPRCTECWEATATLSGTVGWRSATLGRGSVPLTVTATLDVALVTRTTPAAYGVRAVPRDVVAIGLDVAGLPRALEACVEPRVRERVAAALAGARPFDVTEVARDELPVRAVRVAPEGAGLRVELLSEAPSPGRVAPRDPRLRVGWLLEASAASVGSLARREAFRAPHQAFDLVPVPESLAIDGGRFQLGLRLWRLSPPGWWRDYTAGGTVEVRFGEIALAADRVDEGPRSAGAGRADPLALLAEGVILDAITDVLQRTVPASGTTTVQGREVRVAVERIGGRDGTIEVGGTLVLGAPGAR